MGNEESLPELDPSKVNVSERDKQLKSLPYYIPPNHQIEILDLMNNRLEKLPVGLCSLKNLNIGGNLFKVLNKPLTASILSYPLLCELNLSGNKLRELPECLNELKNVHTIVLHHNKLTEFNLKLPNLQKLDLMCNRLTNFTTDSTTLTHLNLNFNFLTEITFSSKTLIQLLCAGNLITNISQDCYFPSLVLINLSHNKLLELTNWDRRFPAITQFSVSYNFLSALPEPLSPNTLTIIASDNYIAKLPDNLVNLKRLGSLIVDNNHLETLPKLPPSLEKLALDNNRFHSAEPIETNLKQLQISRNNFKVLPDISGSPIGIFCASYNLIDTIKPSFLYRGIQRLDFTSCKIEVINPALFRLPQLKNLVLVNNKIKEIPPQIADSSLYFLNLSQNPLESVPTFPNTIQRLYLAQCNLTIFPEKISKLTKLQYLDISCNSIDVFPPEIKCIFINASCNNISRFPVLSDAVKIADFSFNQLTKVEINSQFSSLQELDVSHNSLNYLNICPLRNLQILKLSHNEYLNTNLDLAKYASLATLDITSTNVYVDVDDPEDCALRDLFCDRPFEKFIQKQFHFDHNTYFGYSEMKGSRETMEDALIVRTNVIQGYDVFAVLDGHAGTDSCSFIAKTLPNMIAELPNISTEAISNKIIECNDLLRAKLYKDGTTLNMIVKKGKHILCFNVGDSRAIVVKMDGSIFPLTVDHKPDTQEEIDRIRLRGGFVMDKRTSGVLSMSRSLGDFGVRGIVPTPSFIDYNAQPNDFRVVMCCDGVFDVMTNEEVGFIVASESDTMRCAAIIRNIAFTRMSLDNISVIVVDVHNPQ